MSNYYDIITIQHYLNGTLSGEKMHQLELDALKDPMLQDAIDGFAASKTIDHHDLSLLQQRLHARISQKHEERNHFYFGRQRLAIASVAGVLFIVVCILFWMINFPIKKADQGTSEMKEVLVEMQSEVNTHIVQGNIEPAIGWEKFNHYLRINNQENISDETTELSFEVVNKRPTSIKTISSSSEKASNAAVQLLEDGPDWEGTTGTLMIQF